MVALRAFRASFRPSHSHPHSLITIGAVMTLSAPLIAIDGLYFWAVVGGYWSAHLWIDVLNIRGIDLFWPSPIRLVTPGTAGGGRTGGDQGRTLRGLVSRIDQSRPYYFGRGGNARWLGASPPWPGGWTAWTPITRPATGAGFSACTTPALAELEPWLDRVAVRGEVVQFWLRPGEAAVTPGAGEEAGGISANLMDKVLKRL